MLSAFVRLGVDLFRVNASHGTAVEHAKRIRLVRQLARRYRKSVGILIDLPGPKFRLKELPKGERVLKAGQQVELSAHGGHGARVRLPLRQTELLASLRSREFLFLADGTVALEVLRATPTSALCMVLTSGTVRSGSGLNLPNTRLDITLPTKKDREWIAFAAEQKAEWLAVSFVQSREDLQNVRAEAQHHGYKPKIMAKIEKRRALANLESIVKAADGVMVARGDLGVETPLEEIPFVQKRIIRAANRARKFVITATQMLESMTHQPTPTRAEVTDVANAILDGTNGVMLSAESAIGQYPVEAVKVLARVLSATENYLRTGSASRGAGAASGLL